MLDKGGPTAVLLKYSNQKSSNIFIKKVEIRQETAFLIKCQREKEGRLAWRHRQGSPEGQWRVSHSRVHHEGSNTALTGWECHLLDWRPRVTPAELQSALMNTRNAAR
jgi:hypothetical protein